MKVALIRHMAPLIAPGVCYGRLDVPLTAAGLEEIPSLAAHTALADMRLIWSSPAKRCWAAADAIAEFLSAEVIVDSRLLEMDFGDWEGKAWDDIPRDALDRWAAAPEEFAAPGGESGAALLARVGGFADDLRQKGRDCVVVSHGGPLKVLSALLNGAPVDLLAPAPAIGSVTVVIC
jgi:alpha-ribazole phosphatase